MNPAQQRAPRLADIETALKHASNADRLRMLMDLTDLFAANQAFLSDDQVRLFGDIMTPMMARIENEALVELGVRLSVQPKAPIDVVQKLARHDSISVAGAVLTNSPRLSDDDLIEIAKTKSQAHLVSIARRSRISEVVTDVLIDHGDENVAHEVAQNPGASISEPSMGKLVMRADGDERLTMSISKRHDLSPRLFRQLVSQATEAVRQKLVANARPEQSAALEQVLGEISLRLAGRSNELRDYAAARRRVAAFSQDTKVTKGKLHDFATAGHVTEIVVILSVLSAVPEDSIDMLLDRVDPMPVFIVCRSLELPWRTAEAVVSTCWGAAAALGRERDYNALSPDSARRIVRFWQGRTNTAKTFFAGL